MAQVFTTYKVIIKDILAVISSYYVMTDGGCFDTLLGKPITQIPLPCHVHGINPTWKLMLTGKQYVCVLLYFCTSLKMLLLITSVDVTPSPSRDSITQELS